MNDANSSRSAVVMVPEAISLATQLRELEEMMKGISLPRRLITGLDTFVFSFLLRRRRRALLSSLKVQMHLDPLYYLWAGDCLYGVSEFECSRMCFVCAIEVLNIDDQDMRLRILVGKLECDLAMELQKMAHSSVVDSAFCVKAKDVCMSIRQDLYAASYPVRVSLLRRLVRIDIKLAAFPNVTEVDSFRKALNRSPS